MNLVTIKHIDAQGTLVFALVFDMNCERGCRALQSYAVAGAALAAREGWTTRIEKTGPRGYHEAFAASGSAGRAYP